MDVFLFMIILMGPPGSGKGTQSRLLEQKLGYEHVSTGDLIRSEIRSQTPLGEKFRKIIEKGGLVDDESVFALLQKQFALVKARGIILDGFPRTQNQAQMLEKLTHKMNIHVVGVYSIDMDDEEIVNRLSARLYCHQCGASFNTRLNPPKTENTCDFCGHTPLEKRTDDTLDTIRARLLEYNQRKDVIRSYYEGAKLWNSVSGYGRPEEVCSEIMRSIENKMKKGESKA